MPNVERTLMEGTPFETPVYKNEGEKDGKTVMIVGGQHGNEPAGWKTSEQFTDCHVEQGTLIVIPRACVPAIEQGVYTPNELDVNMNDHWDPDSDPTSEIGRQIWAVADDYHPEIYIDNHSSRAPRARGGVGNALYPTPEGRDAAKKAAGYVNNTCLKQSDYGTDWYWTVGNDQGEQDEYTLIDRVGYRLEVPAWIIESARGGSTLEERVRWQTAANVKALEECGVTVNPDKPKKPKPKKPEQRKPKPGKPNGSGEKKVDLGHQSHKKFREGRKPINDLIEETLSDTTTYIFPSGWDYRVERPIHVHGCDDVDFIAPVGERATWTVPHYFEHYQGDPVIASGWSGEPCDDFALERIDIDISADGVGQRAYYPMAKYNLDIDSRLLGRRSATRKKNKPAYGNINTAQFGLTSHTGRGDVALELPWGGEYMDKSDQSSEFIGINVEPNMGASDQGHNGNLTFHDCYVNGFANNAFYLYRSKHETGEKGTVTVRDSVTNNCGYTNYRTDRGDRVEACSAFIDENSRAGMNAVAGWQQGGGHFDGFTVHRENGENKLFHDSNLPVVERYENLTIENYGNGDIFNFSKNGGRVIVEHADVQDYNDDPSDSGKGENDYFTSRINRDNVEFRHLTYVTRHDKRRGMVVDGDYFDLKRSAFDVYDTAVEVSGTGAEVCNCTQKSSTAAFKGF